MFLKLFWGINDIVVGILLVLMLFWDINDRLLEFYIICVRLIIKIWDDFCWRLVEKMKLSSIGKKNKKENCDVVCFVIEFFVNIYKEVC